MTAPWTEAHRREALRRTYEIAAGTDEVTARLLMVGVPARPASEDPRVACEAGWRCVLSEAGYNPARIDREVRRVRALAEGRLVREARWRVVYSDGSRSSWPTADEAREAAKPNIWRKRAAVVRVTCIRRAP